MVENHSGTTWQISTENPWGHILFTILVVHQPIRKQALVSSPLRGQHLTDSGDPTPRTARREGENELCPLSFPLTMVLLLPLLACPLYFIWVNAPHPGNPGPRETSPLLHPSLPSPSSHPPHTHTLSSVHSISALIDRLFCHLPLFCA